MEDQTIIDLFIQRSEHAISELALKYEKLCFSLSNRILKNESDAQECVNDTYLAAWNTIPPQKPDPLSAYVCRITRNITIKKYHANTALKRNNYYDVLLEEIAECLVATENVESEILAKEMEGILNEIQLTKAEKNPTTQRDVAIRGISGLEEIADENIEQNSYLLRNETQVISPIDGVTITGYGFIHDELHIQVHYENILQYDNHGYVSLKDQNNNTVDSMMSVSFWDESHSGSYDEYIFPISSDMDLSAYKVYGYFTTCNSKMIGNWKVTFPIKNK